jgi:LssY C-terminus
MHTRQLFAPVLILFAANLLIAQAVGNSEKSFTVSGVQTWLDTGIDVVPGDSVFIDAEAKAGSDSSCSPNGTQGTQAGDKAPLPLESKGALIARPTDHSDAIVIGKTGQLNVDSQGRLFLGINQDSPSTCVYLAKVRLEHEPAAATPSQTGMRDKLSSAAQVFMKSQFGGKESPEQGESNSAASGNAAVSASAGGSSGLKLPSVILDADLRKNIDGLPRRVHDHLGNMGDMVNFVFVGNQEKVQTALAAAEWHVADVDTKEAGLKAILNTYQKKDYVEMPMSHLYLFDRMQDFGYEQAQAFSVVATRHHFRMWKAPFTWNDQTVWVGAATHDTGFEKDVRTGKLTHKIDPNVDEERDSLGQGLEKTGKAKSMTYYLPPNPVQDAKNASGGSYHSDGRILVVFLN